MRRIHLSLPARWIFLVGVAFLLSSVSAIAADAPEPTPDQLDFFESKIRPVLSRHCYECHGAESKKAKGGLRLDTRDGLLKGGDSGPAIVPGKPDKSLLITAVRHAEDELKMPKQKLAQHEIDALVEWVRIGAPDPRTGELTAAATPVSRYDWDKERQHWAYRPGRDAAPPTATNTDWARTDIDRFILAKLEEKNLRPVPDADPRTLIRRMTYDLTGLPPTSEEVEAFLSESRSNPQSAVSALIDRLLASPHYGERWGRHWMDLVRYADTAGDNSDYPVPQLYLYRNYVIDAFNRDKPYDQFVREQIAGDLLPARDQAQRNEQVIATGYVALSRRFGSVVDRYPQHLTIEDTIDNLGKTFLGLTLACARCHDHKFDAVTQRDYYAIYGIFASTRYAFPGIELLKIQKDFVPLLSSTELEKQFGPFNAKARELQKTHDDLAAKRKKMEADKAELEKRIAAATGEEKTKLAADANRLHQEIEKVRGNVRNAAKAVEDHQKTRPRVADAYAVQDDKPADAKVHLKGEPERLGEAVPRRWLELFGAQPLPASEAQKTSGRRQLADWIVSPTNPLTARVIVNRVWQHHFGSGLVKTPNDFGIRGQPPTHPELLDHLATRFVADGWSIKKLHRRILLSRAYQLSSQDDERGIAADTDHHWHWRFARRRLDAESLRDTLLAMSNTLDRSPLTEPHPFPPIEKWEFTQHHPFRAEYPSNRRTVYLMSARLTASPFLQTFDGADPNASTPTRDSSVTTVQALYWLNDRFLHEQADRFAKRVMDDAATDEERLTRAFTLALQRAPSPEEQGAARSFMDQVRQRIPDSPKAAWAAFARALFRSNEFLYID